MTKFFRRFLIWITICGSSVFPQQNNILISGGISGSTKYYMDIPVNQSYLKKFDYVSNSFLSIQADRVKFSASISKPMYYFRAGQPDRNYTLELTSPYISGRLGDVNVQFTPNTTPYIKIFGFGASANLGSFLEVQTVNGMSRFAVPTEGYFLGGYSQELNGHRVAVTPIREIKLGVSYMRVKDDPRSMDFSGSPVKINSNENVILGGDINLYLFSRKLNLGAEYISSFFNSDNSWRGGRLTRYDSPVLKWLGGKNLVQQWMNLNDSSAAGEVVAGKLNVSFLQSSTTIDYRRASRYAWMLTFPYEQSDIEKLRFNNSTRFLDGSLVFMLNGQFNRTNISHTMPVSTSFLNLNTSLSYDLGIPGRIMFSWRQSDRYNNALPPSGKEFDKRMNIIYKSAVISYSKDFGIGEFPISLTGSVTGNWNTNKIRKGTDSEGFIFQVMGQIMPPSVFFMSSNISYGWNLYQYSGARRNLLQVQLQQGYQFIPDILRIYVNEGFYLNTTSGTKDKTLNLLYGAGIRAELDMRTSAEFEWQVFSYRDFVYTRADYLQQSLELKINYGF